MGENEGDGCRHASTLAWDTDYETVIVCADCQQIVNTVGDYHVASYMAKELVELVELWRTQEEMK